MPGPGTHTEEWDRAVKACQAQRRKDGKDPEACYGIITKRFKEAGKKIYNENAKIVILKGSFLAKFDAIERIETNIELEEKEPQTEYIDLEDGWKLAKGILRVRVTGLTEGTWCGVDGNTVTYPLDAIHSFAESQLKQPRKHFHDNKDGKTVGFNTGIKLIENGYKYQSDVFNEKTASMIENGKLDGSSDELEILATQIGETDDKKPHYLALEIKGKGAAFVRYPACDDAGIDEFRRIDLEVFSTTTERAMELEEAPAAEEITETPELEQTEEAPEEPQDDSKVEELEKALEAATGESKTIANEMETIKAENAKMQEALKMINNKLGEVTGELEEKKDQEWKELEGKVKASVPGYNPAILEGMDRDKKTEVLSYLLSLKPALEEKDNDKETRTASEALTGAMEQEESQKSKEELRKDAILTSLNLKTGNRAMTYEDAMKPGALWGYESKEEI